MIPKINLPSPRKITNKVKDLVSPRDEDGHRRNLAKECARGIRNSGVKAYRHFKPRDVAITNNTLEHGTADPMKSIRLDFYRTSTNFFLHLNTSGGIGLDPIPQNSQIRHHNEKSTVVGKMPEKGDDISHLAPYWSEQDFSQMNANDIFDFFCASIRVLDRLGGWLLPDDPAEAKVYLSRCEQILDNIDEAFYQLAFKEYKNLGLSFSYPNSMTAPVEEMKKTCRELSRRLDDSDSVSVELIESDEEPRQPLDKTTEKYMKRFKEELINGPFAKYDQLLAAQESTEGIKLANQLGTAYRQTEARPLRSTEIKHYLAHGESLEFLASKFRDPEMHPEAIFEQLAYLQKQMGYLVALLPLDPTLAIQHLTVAHRLALTVKAGFDALDDRNIPVHGFESIHIHQASKGIEAVQQQLRHAIKTLASDLRT